MLTSSVEDSPASQLAAQEKGKAKKMKGGYGRSSAESFAAFGPNGCLSKMYRGCYLLTLEGSLLEYCETFPKAGMMRNGILYRLPALEHHTSEKECSSSQRWSTPCTGDIFTKKAALRPPRIATGRKTDYLARQVLMWPTPTKSDGGGGPGCSGRDGGENLRTAVQSFPTPRAHCQDMATMMMSRYSGTERKTGSERAQYDPAIGGQLNTAWVELLMGFPKDYTSIDL